MPRKGKGPVMFSDRDRPRQRPARAGRVRDAAFALYEQPRPMFARAPTKPYLASFTSRLTGERVTFTFQRRPGR